MSGFLLDTYPAGATVYALFHTYNSAGASVTISGLATTDIEIYKNGSTTQRSSDNGYALLDTDGIDFDSLTGIHGLSIDLSDNTDPGFYAAGSQYTVVVSTITVDSQTVSFIVGTFRIVAAEATAGYPAVTIKSGTGTGELSLSSGAVIVQSGTGTGQISLSSGTVTVASNGLANVTAWTVAITGNITGNLSGSVGSVTGAVGSVTGNVGGNVVGSVASVSGAVGSVTGNVGGNVTGSVGSLATQAKADVNAEVVDALATDTYAEPGQGAPAATASLATKIGLLHKMARNKITQSSTTFSLFADDGTTVDQKATVSDDSTTFTRGELASGP